MAVGYPARQDHLDGDQRERRHRPQKTTIRRHSLVWQRPPLHEAFLTEPAYRTHA